LYINDIHTAIPDVKVKLFADDTNVFLFEKDCQCLVLRATECLNRLNEWLVANRLTLNITKTCFYGFFKEKG